MLDDHLAVTAGNANAGVGKGEVDVGRVVVGAGRSGQHLVPLHGDPGRRGNVGQEASLGVAAENHVGNV